MFDDSYANPFPECDVDRHRIWEILVRVDLDAFAAGDWAMLEPHFEEVQFEGLVANESFDPDRWTLAYPTLDAYRDAFLQMAADFAKLPLTKGTHRELLSRLTRLNEIEVKGDRAVAHKKFLIDEPLADGDRFSCSKQTLYRLHHIDGDWKIVGFVGYLPLRNDRPQPIRKGPRN